MLHMVVVSNVSLVGRDTGNGLGLIVVGTPNK